VPAAGLEALTQFMLNFVHVKFTLVIGANVEAVTAFLLIG
jgi:hypothetical protein